MSALNGKPENPESSEPESVQNDWQADRLNYLLVFCLAWTVRSLHIFSLSLSPIFSYKIGDAAKYDLWAKSLAAGNWIGEGVFYQAPLYPYFLGLVYSVFGHDPFTVRQVQACLGAISCVMIMKAASNLFGKRPGLVAGLFLTFYAPSIFLEGLIQKSVLDLFFLSMLLWLFSESLASSRKRIWLTMGLATGALCLTRENALVLVPIVIFWVAVGQCRAQAKTHVMPRLKCGSMFMLGLFLTLGPVSVRNYYVGGQFHLTTSQLGPNFYIGNNPQADGTYRPLLPGRGDAMFEQTDAVALAETETGRRLTPREVSRFYLQKSGEYIWNQPFAWLRLMGLKTALTFNAAEILDTEDQYTLARWSPILRISNYVFHFGTLLPIAMMGIYLTRTRWRSIWVLYLMLLAFALTVIVFFVFGRYRFPLAPILILFAAPAIVDFWDRVNSWKKTNSKLSRPLVGMATTFAFLFVVCNLRIISPTNGQGITLSNYGVQALIRHDFDNAEAFLTAAVNSIPGSALAHNNLAVMYRETGRLALARHHFELAIELEPTDTKIQANLQNLVAMIPN
jgi:4-amino-4-deoxy-L-arabinose transferase-like glycosyltransferase